MLPPSATNSFTSPTSHFCVTRLPMSSPLPIDLRTDTDIYTGGGEDGSHRNDPPFRIRRMHLQDGNSSREKKTGEGKLWKKSGAADINGEMEVISL
ncbi:hypothetical protein CDAR_296551 [Caerostris darwini]|uniref:Uncharacterized protein n=1 Tax=Caerostris darwini TaxID=1538125 RepID=A0AAV4PKF7_9ARAC|nr:hypothetical protein CDAR_296551 [Caerostris darwini]